MPLGMVDPIRGADFQAHHLLLTQKYGSSFDLTMALAVEVAYRSYRGGKGAQQVQVGEITHRSVQHLRKHFEQFRISFGFQLNS